MNRYHQNHPDPEIREKFSSWQEAHANYLSRVRGFRSYAEEQAKIEKDKAQEAKRTILNQLKMIGANVAHHLKNNTATDKAKKNKAKKIRRASGRRGS